MAQHRSRAYVVLDLDIEDDGPPDTQYLRDWLEAMTAPDGEIVSVHTDPKEYLRAIKREIVPA